MFDHKRLAQSGFRICDEWINMGKVHKNWSKTKSPEGLHERVIGYKECDDEVEVWLKRASMGNS